MVKWLLATRETWVQSLGGTDPLEKKMATHCSNLAWKTPWTGEPGRLQSMGSQRVGHARATSLFFFSWLNPALYFSLELWSDAQARVLRNHLFL